MLNSLQLAYEGHPKSFRPRHIRQQYFPSVKRTFFTKSNESVADMTSL